MALQANLDVMGQIEPAAELMSSAAVAAQPGSPTASNIEAVGEEAITRLIRPRAGVEIHQYSSGGRAYERSGNTYTTPHEHPEMIRTLVQEAQENQWQHIHVKGSPSFTSAVWEAAAERDIHVHGYQPTAAQREALAEKRRQQAQSQTENTEPRDNQLRRANVLDRAGTWVGRAVEKGRQIANSLFAENDVEAAPQRDRHRDGDRSRQHEQQREQERESGSADEYQPGRPRRNILRRLYDAAKSTLSGTMEFSGAVLSGAGETLRWAGRKLHNTIFENNLEYEEPRERHDIPRQRSQPSFRQAPDVDRDSHIDAESVPESAIQSRFYKKDGTNIYFHMYVNEQGIADGTNVEAFRDHGLKLTTHTKDPRIIDTLVQFAEARKWTAINVKGTEDFRREAWNAAAIRGIEVKGYEPTAEEQAELTAAIKRHHTEKDRQNSMTAESASTEPSRAAAATAAESSAAHPAPHPATYGPPLAQSEPQRTQRTGDDMIRMVQEAMKFERGTPEYLEYLKREGIEARELEKWALENSDALGRAAALLPGTDPQPVAGSQSTTVPSQSNAAPERTGDSPPVTAAPSESAQKTGPGREAAKAAAETEARASAKTYMNTPVAPQQSGTLHLPVRNADVGLAA